MAQISTQERERRNAVDRERRWRNGVTPRALSLSQRRPWEAEGVSRRTWYRRRETVPPPPVPHQEQNQEMEITGAVPPASEGASVGADNNPSTTEQGEMQRQSPWGNDVVGWEKWFALHTEEIGKWKQ